MTATQAFAFVAACLGFGFIPGPALLQTISITLQYGRRAGLLSAFGIHIGALLQIGAVAIGAAVVLRTTPWLYRALCVGAGGYLIWLGIQRIRTRPDNGIEPPSLPGNIVSSSALIEATNPKSALFYLSFLLPFVDTSTSLGIGPQLLLLGVAANLLFSFADLICIVLASQLRESVAPGGTAMTVGRYLAGALFIAMGSIAIIEH